jgi:mRNA interferase HigB
MRILTFGTLHVFWKSHPQAEMPLRTWYSVTKAATWKNSAEVVATFNTASILPNDRVVFNIHGNTFRLVTAINYSRTTVFVKFIGTHAECDRIDAKTISLF